MSLDRTGGHYDRMTIALHWTTAALVVLLWIFGQTADLFPRGPLQTGVWSLHIALGFALTVVLLVRVLWRAGPGRGLPAADQGILHLIAKITHYLLYVVLALAVALGIANAFVRGYSLFGLFSLPQIGDRALRRPITGYHELAANAVVIVALVHAGAALVHHYLWHDGVLRRMTVAHRD